MASQAGAKRFSPSAGIAIGPILFIIAILAILAAAIAAGSGSFTSGTSTESNRTKSSALIQIGENIKVGMDRITMEGGLDPNSVDTNTTDTNTTNDLFSPTGGGIAPPSVGMANNPLTDKWYFPKGPIAGLGTGANDVIAALPISEGVCAEVNNRAVGSAVAPTAANLGDFTGGIIAGTAWPTVAAGGVNLLGVATGCVNNSGVTVGTGVSSNYFYYQVLSVQ